MTIKDYLKQYDNAPNYKIIAERAFKAGLESAKPTDVKRLQNELKEAKKELPDLYDTLYDPEKCGEFLAGL